MEQLAFLGELRKYLTRRNIEIFSVIVVILCAFSIFFGKSAIKTVVQINDGEMTYNGNMVANKMSGYGTLTYKNGDKYEGYFKDGLFEGQGTFTSKDKWVYVGNFKKGVADGQGKLTTENNIVYEGTFKEGIYKNEN